MEIAPDKFPCQGINVSDPSSGDVLYPLRESFHLWATMANFAENAKHRYSYDASDGSWTIISGDCMGVAVATRGNIQGRKVCPQCLLLGKPKQVVRTVCRFMMKYYMAQLLSCQLFHGQAALAELEEQIRAGAFYKKYAVRMSSLMKLPALQKQQYVRASWLKDHTGTKAVKDFVAIVVKPCLQVNVNSIPDQLAEISARFTCILAGGRASEQDMIDLKLASSVISGRLQGHPLIQGLALQCHRKLEKEERGVGMQGRRSSHTELEAYLIRDAGVQLAIAAGNSTLAREFGLNPSSHKVKFDMLSERNLPVPALAVCWPDVLQQNFLLTDQRFLRPQTAPKRSLKASLFEPP